MILRVPRELVSPNKWNGKHWRTKHRLTQAWEQDIAWLARAQRLEPPATPGRCRVAVTRETPNGHHWIRDDDNLRFCVKPLLDALKRSGYIKNDSRKWLDLPTPEQKVSADGQHWTVIEITRVEA